MPHIHILTSSSPSHFIFPLFDLSLSNPLILRRHPLWCDQFATHLHPRLVSTTTSKLISTLPFQTPPPPSPSPSVSPQPLADNTYRHHLLIGILPHPNHPPALLHPFRFACLLLTRSPQSQASTAQPPLPSPCEPSSSNGGVCVCCIPTFFHQPFSEPGEQP